MRKPKALDIVLFALYGAALVMSRGFLPEGDGVLKVSTENGDYAYSMKEDGIHEFTGPLGMTAIEIKDGKARVVSSPCPGKTCVESGWSKSLCCLPNRVIAVVTGDDGGPDAVSG